MGRVYLTINDIPRRGPDEEPATKKQLDYLRRMAHFKESDLEELGQWQASLLIDQAKEIRDEISSGGANVKRNKGCGCLALIILTLVVAGSIKLLYDRHSEGGAQTGSKPQEAPTGLPEPDKGTPPKPQPEATASPDHKSAPQPEQPTIAKAELVTTLNGVRLPVIVVTTEQFDLLNELGKETPIPAGSIIKIEKRGEKGSLTMKIKGALFVGNELRLFGKVRLR